MGGIKILGNCLKSFLRTDGKVIAPRLSFSLFGSNCKYVRDSIKNAVKPNKSAKAFEQIMITRPDADKAAEACAMFTKETGVKMFMTDSSYAQSFSTFGHTLIRDIKSGAFPKDIKHIIIGHGSGSTLNDTWHVAYNPKVKIFDFIKENIPKGEKVLTICCEETPKELRHLIPKNKPAMGKYTTEGYSSYKHPLKIVESGRDEIIGGYANGIATYYV